MNEEDSSFNTRNAQFKPIIDMEQSRSKKYRESRSQERMEEYIPAEEEDRFDSSILVSALYRINEQNDFDQHISAMDTITELIRENEKKTKQFLLENNYFLVANSFLALENAEAYMKNLIPSITALVGACNQEEIVQAFPVSIIDYVIPYITIDGDHTINLLLLILNLLDSAKNIANIMIERDVFVKLLSIEQQVSELVILNLKADETLDYHSNFCKFSKISALCFEIFAELISIDISKISFQLINDLLSKIGIFLGQNNYYDIIQASLYCLFVIVQDSDGYQCFSNINEELKIARNVCMVMRLNHKEILTIGLEFVKYLGMCQNDILPYDLLFDAFTSYFAIQDYELFDKFLICLSTLALNLQAIPYFDGDIITSLYGLIESSKLDRKSMIIQIFARLVFMSDVSFATKIVISDGIIQEFLDNLLIDPAGNQNLLGDICYALATAIKIHPQSNDIIELIEVEAYEVLEKYQTDPHGYLRSNARYLISSLNTQE